jgi:hypothetical protein
VPEGVSKGEARDLLSIKGTSMTERGAGQPNWPLSPYQLNVSYGTPGAAGEGADWFGPLTPITPLAPPDVAGRQWDFPSGYNLSTLPRVYEPVTFATLRGLADAYDLLRLVIETRKDQVARLDWSLSARNKKLGNDPRITAIKAFLVRPDGRHAFADWLRLLLEELFVIDAPALYKSRDRAGRLIALLPIDGATIKPVIDDWGRTPQPYVENGETLYPVAYQQILKGYPAIDYSVRDLLYRPRNIRVNRAYGFSPVEQIITSVNIALRRQAFVLDYFTQGNIPDSLIGVPENWTPDQIASYQKYWDAYFDGDLTRRRRAKFVPGGVAKTFVQTKEPDLKSPFDEWLARVVCFAFSVSPQALVSQMNRATAQTQKETSQEEGLAPVLAWVKGLIDDLLADEFGAPDLEFVWSADPAIDPQTQETILTSYATKGILTINEVRAALGREPLQEAAANKPMALAVNGYVALSEQAAAGRESGQKVLKAFDGCSCPDERAVLRSRKVADNSDLDENKHPRWPKGSADDQAGRFRPKGDGEDQTTQSALLDDCDKEWEEAHTFCQELLSLHEFHPMRRLAGGYTTVDGCAMGFVSERCGGNKVR